MALFRTAAEHAANPPETWLVVKVADRNWQLRTKDGDVLDYANTTRKGTEELKLEGFYVRMYRQEADWFARQGAA